MQPYKSILVGTDFSSCSAAAIRHAGHLAQTSGASLKAFHVIDTFATFQLQADLSELQRDISRGLLEDANDAWRQFTDEHRLGGIVQIFEVQIGNRVPALLAKAKTIRADLFVAGAFGDRKPDLGIGTIATGCVRHAHCDVLIVRDTHQGPFRSILACVDFSPISRKALDRAAQLAAQEKAALHVLHVYPGPTAAFPFLTSLVKDWVEVVTDFESRALAQLKAFCAPIANDAISFHVVESVRHGREIATFARTHAIDLLVLGKRGHSNARDILLGTTAERELRDSPCSVLVVAPDSSIDLPSSSTASNRHPGN